MLRLTRILNNQRSELLNSGVSTEMADKTANNIQSILNKTKDGAPQGQFRRNVPLVVAAFGAQFAGYEAAATYIVPTFDMVGRSWLGLASPVVLYATLITVGGWGPKLLQRYSGRTVATLGALTYAIYSTSLGLFRDSPFAILGASLLLGAGASLFWQGAAKIINSSVTSNHANEIAHGKKMTALWIGSAIGTCTFAAFLTSVSPAALFLCCGALSGLATILISLTKAHPPVVESQIDDKETTHRWSAIFTDKKWLRLVAALGFFRGGVLAVSTGALKLDAIRFFGTTGITFTGPAFRIVMALGGFCAGMLATKKKDSTIFKIAGTSCLGLAFLSLAPHVPGGMAMFIVGTALLAIFPSLGHPLFQGLISQKAKSTYDRDLGTAAYITWGNIGMFSAFILPLVLPPVASYFVFASAFLLVTTH